MTSRTLLSIFNHIRLTSPVGSKRYDRLINQQEHYSLSSIPYELVLFCSLIKKMNVDFLCSPPSAKNAKLCSFIIKLQYGSVISGLKIACVTASRFNQTY